ncbi:MAG: histidine kinase N-terminal 7TM domain-containing protein, partial [Anaerolineae bacterium]
MGQEAVTSQVAPYILLSIAATASLLISALYLWSYRPRLLGAGSAAILFLAGAEWMLASAVGLASTGLATKVLWDKAQYLGMVVVPAAWLAFALQYTGRAKKLAPRTLCLLGVVPLITVLLAFTNDAHGLIWSRVVLDTSRPFVELDKTYGAGFWVFISYSYSLVLFAAALLAQMAVRSPRLYRWPAAAILCAMPVPWLLSALEVLDLNPLPMPEPTVLGLAVAGPILAWALPRFWLGNVGPVAREAIIERMGDGVLVLDEEDRVVDLNPVAERLLSCTLAEVIGQPVAKVWPKWPDQLLEAADPTHVGTELVLGTGDLERIYDMRISDLVDWRGHMSSRVAVLRDITERRRAEDEAHRRSDELAALNAIAMNVTSTLELEEILRTIQKSVLRLLGEKYAPLFALFNERDQTLDLMLTGIQQPALRAAEKLVGLKLDQLTLPVAALNRDMWDALLARKPYVTTEGSNLVESSMYRRLIQAVQTAMDAKCMVHLPLWVKGKLVGSMLVFFQRERVSDEEIEVLSAVASQAAIAIENARLYDESQRRFRQSELLRTASEAVASTLDLPEVLRRIAEQITLSIDATSAYICDIEPQADRTTVLAEYYGPEACAEEQVSDLRHTYKESNAEFMAVMRANQCCVDHIDDPDLPEGDR